jgi:serine O-acetyltransferase
MLRGLKKWIKNINDSTIILRILVFLPIYIYMRSKRIKLRFSNFIYSHYYYYSGRLSKLNEINISIKTLGKNKIIFPHPIGIVIGNFVTIDENSVIYQNVTIGAKSYQTAKYGEYPIIGKNVIIYGNSMIFGPIKIGDNSIIGAGSIISIDIPANCLAYGVNKFKTIDNHIRRD